MKEQKQKSIYGRYGRGTPLMYLDLEAYRYMPESSGPGEGWRYRLTPTLTEDGINELPDCNYSHGSKNFNSWIAKEMDQGNLAAAYLSDLLMDFKREKWAEVAKRYQYDAECWGQRQRNLGMEIVIERIKQYVRGFRDMWRPLAKTEVDICGKVHSWNGSPDYYYVYFLICGGELVYVGQASNLQSRLKGHKDKKYDTIKYIMVLADDVDMVESCLISAYKPKYNKSSGNAPHIPFGQLSYMQTKTKIGIIECLKILNNGKKRHLEKAMDLDKRNSMEWMGCDLVSSRKSRKGTMAIK